MLETVAAKIGESLLLKKLGSIPSWVWVLVAGILLAVGGFIWHNHAVGEFEESIRADQKTKDQNAFKAQLDAAHADALNRKTIFTSKSDTVTTQESSNHATAVTNNAVLASQLRTSASQSDCRYVGSSTSEQSSSGHGQGSRTAIHAEVGPVHTVSGTDLIAVPRDDLITLAEHYDNNFDEVKTWRTDKKQQEILYQQLLSNEVSGK